MTASTVARAGRVTFAGMSDRGYRPPRALSPLREHLRETFWFAPTLTLICAVVLWFIASALDEQIVAYLQDQQAYDEITDLVSIAEDTKTIVVTISSAMMTFIGVVFSISLVAVQMASGQLTPRVVRIFVRSRISKLTLSVFLATFVFSLLVLSSYESTADPRRVVSVPFLQSILTAVLVGLSLLLFIAYVSATLRLMQVGPVVDRITRDSFHVLRRMPVGGPREEALPAETGQILHEGRAGVLRDVNVARLVRAARQQGAVLRLVPRLGDFVVPGTPVLAVHGGTAPPRRALRYTVSVGVERTLHQDLAFGLRQLSDIALRALSPHGERSDHRRAVPRPHRAVPRGRVGAPPRRRPPPGPQGGGAARSGRAGVGGPRGSRVRGDPAVRDRQSAGDAAAAGRHR